MKYVERGWSRVAFQKVKCTGSNSFIVQATIWRDKRLVGFLHNHKVDLTALDTVKRWSPTKKCKKEIKSHPVVNDYAHHMNGVDKKDRDTSDWTVSLKSYRFYLRIFYWTFDGVIHAMQRIIKNIVDGPGVDNKKKKKKKKSHPFSRYVDKDWGHYRFQMDLGIALINYGLSIDWKDPTNKKVPRPSYVRQRKDWVPCDCHNKGARGCRKSSVAIRIDCGVPFQDFEFLRSFRLRIMPILFCRNVRRLYMGQMHLKPSLDK